MNIGPLEVVLILVLALLIFGPDKLPAIGRDVGKALRSFRDASTNITREVNRQLAEIEEEAKSVVQAADTSPKEPAKVAGEEPGAPVTPVPYHKDAPTGQGNGDVKS